MASPRPAGSASRARRTGAIRRGGLNAIVSEKKKFIRPCKTEDCRGFLSSGYKCEICETFTCPKCLDVLGPDKNVEHTCKESDVKSAELIRKETKPCPSCGFRISKISGCPQMWCTECHTAFNWKTGFKETGTVHNPHFYCTVPGNFACSRVFLLHQKKKDIGKDDSGVQAYILGTFR